MQHLKIKIDVTKLDKTAFHDGKHGAKYCSLLIFANKNGEDQYGNTHSVKQDLGMERRGEVTNFIGRGKPLGAKSPPQQNAHNQSKANAYQPEPKFDADEADDIPF